MNEADSITIIIGAECFDDREPRAYVKLRATETQVVTEMVHYLDQSQIADLITDLQKTARALDSYACVDEAVAD
jgi:hypothetical protein